MLEIEARTVLAASVSGMDTLEAFISALPKVELHVHLVGSAPSETVLRLARRHPDRGVPSSAEGLREFYDPHDGRGMGAHDFAWSALALELLDPGNAGAGVPGGP